MIWFLHDEVYRDIKEARLSNVITSEDRIAYAEAFSKRKISGHSDSKTVIDISGVLTDSPDPIAEFFGGGNTTYEEIRKALAIANKDENVDEIYFNIDSPGGEASSNWLELMNEIFASEKPTTAIVGTMAASAAYGIASQADRILATNKLSSVGSIGVVAGYYINDNVIEITSTDAPNKRPDIQSEEGVSIVKKQLDEMHAIFVETIARGRRVDEDTVNKDFGQGSMLLADSALKAGMINGFFNVEKKEIPEMDLAKLKAERQDLFDAIVTQERDRVMAHLKLGQESNDMITALDAIENGNELTQKITAQYIASAMRKREITNRSIDDSESEIELDVEVKEDAELQSNKIMLAAAERLGISLEGVKL